MVTIQGKPLPGTTATHVAPGEKGFAKIQMLLEAAGGLSLSQVCVVTGLEGTTIQNWVKRGWVAHPKRKKYEEIHIARVLLINALKDCIKLEHIAQLLTYVNGLPENPSDEIIKESVLYNYLCDALQKLGQVDDLSRGGVESVVDVVIKDYKGPKPHARARIRKALAVMIYACVCTDVKRRTEAMMQQVLLELEHPDGVAEKSGKKETEASVEEIIEAASEGIGEAEENSPEEVEETRKTVAQAIREWDLTSVENILNEVNYDDYLPEIEPPPSAPIDNFHKQVEQMKDEQAQREEVQEEVEEKPAQKPWYFRRN